MANVQKQVATNKRNVIKNLQEHKLKITYITLSLLKETHKYVEHKITLYWSGNNSISKQEMQTTHISVV